MSDVDTKNVYDLIIVGSGAAGLSAAIYAGRYLMRVLIAEGEFGGETAVAGTIWNFPGVKGADGFDLMQTMKEQAKEVGTVFVSGRVESVVNENGCYTVKIGSKEFFTKTVLLAQGSERRRLGLANEKELTNKGVHFCTTCDGPLYGGKTVAMVGGGDASVKGINLLLNYASKIYFIVRGKELRAEPINVVHMHEREGGKLEVLYETQVETIHGEKSLDKITVKGPNGSRDLAVDALFIEIGANPDVSIAQSIGVTLDDKGYIAVDNMMQTNVPGVYAAGDAVNHFGAFKQTVTAAALGAVAATSAYNYYKTHGNLCETHWKPVDVERDVAA